MGQRFRDVETRKIFKLYHLANKKDIETKPLRPMRNKNTNRLHSLKIDKPLKIKSQ